MSDKQPHTNKTKTHNGVWKNRPAPVPFDYEAFGAKPPPGQKRNGAAVTPGQRRKT